MHPLMERLKQRKIVQWALAYVAGAVAVYSALEGFAEPWGVGALQLRIVQVTLLVGFFLALTVAWYHGERGEQRVTGVELLILSGIMGLGALGIRIVFEGEQPPTMIERAADQFEVVLSGVAANHAPRGDFEVSPTGVVYVAEDGLWHRAWNDVASARPLGVVGAARGISPDGTTAHRLLGSSIELVPLDGGPPRLVAEGLATSGAHWGGDGFIYFTGTDSALYRVPEAGGEVESAGIERLPGEGRHQRMNLTDGGEIAVFEIQGDPPMIVAHRFDSGARATLAEGYSPKVTTTGHLVYRSVDDAIVAATLDTDDLSLGEQVVVAEDVDGTNWTLSSNGILAYWIAGTDQSELVWVSRSGDAEPVETVGSFDPGVGNRYYALSPDGMRVALAMQYEGDRDIWVYELASGASSRITSWPGEDRAPYWISDDRISFLSQGGDGGQRALWSHRSDGVGEPELVYDNDRNLSNAFPGPDDWIVIRTSGLSGSVGERDIFAVIPGEEPRPIAANPDFAESNPTLSPDGRWVAYNTNESGRYEVVVKSFPGASERIPISVGGGVAPVWARDGSEIFFVSGDEYMIAARVETEPNFRVVDRTRLFDVSDYEHTAVMRPDIGPDRRFLFMRSLPSEPQLALVKDFFETLRRRLPN